MAYVDAVFLSGFRHCGVYFWCVIDDTGNEMTDLSKVAERMFSIAYAVYMERGNEMKATLEIESILREVVEEAILDDRMKRTADDLYKLSRQVGKAEAYRDAAQIADEHNGCIIAGCYGGKCGGFIANLLFRKATEVGGGD